MGPNAELQANGGFVIGIDENRNGVGGEPHVKREEGQRESQHGAQANHKQAERSQYDCHDRSRRFDRNGMHGSHLDIAAYRSGAIERHLHVIAERFAHAPMSHFMQQKTSKCHDGYSDGQRH